VKIWEGIRQFVAPPWEWYSDGAGERRGKPTLTGGRYPLLRDTQIFFAAPRITDLRIAGRYISSHLRHERGRNSRNVHPRFSRDLQREVTFDAVAKLGVFER
tara:strand:- start:180 stop:485 length:306 start_codon:yes stop_codon:yes gene_type:complete